MPPVSTECLIDTPLGPMRASFGPDGRLGRLDFADAAVVVEDADPPDDWRAKDISIQLAQYFAGVRREFSVELAPEGGEFERRVWSELVRVEYGTTVSYGELARRVARPSAARAVGLANARNPLAIVVPCHRVIGADGSLRGYGGGLWRKRALLELEGSRRALGTQLNLDLD